MDPMDSYYNTHIELTLKEIEEIPVKEKNLIELHNKRENQAYRISQIVLFALTGLTILVAIKVSLVAAIPFLALALIFKVSKDKFIKSLEAEGGVLKQNRLNGNVMSYIVIEKNESQKERYFYRLALAATGKNNPKALTPFKLTGLQWNAISSALKSIESQNDMFKRAKYEQYEKDEFYEGTWKTLQYNLGLKIPFDAESKKLLSEIKFMVRFVGQI